MKPRTLLQGLAGWRRGAACPAKLWCVLGHVVRPRAPPGHSGRRRRVARPGGGSGVAAPAGPRLLLPFGPHLEAALLAGAAFSWGLCWIPATASSQGRWLSGASPSGWPAPWAVGLVLAGVVLALATAARRFSRLELPAEGLLLLAGGDCSHRLYAAGSATVYYWDS